MPIVKDLMSENGYTFVYPVTADEMQKFLKPMLHDFKCMILNMETAKRIDILSGNGNRFVTINNKVPNDMFFINSYR